ncbi:hypothetical protein CHUAL_003065 [Chamberlinius hualienensis]
MNLSKAKQAHSFWLSRNGQLTSSILMSVGTGSLIAAHVFPQAAFINYYIDFMHMYRDTEKVPVKEDLVTMIKQVISECDLTQHQRNSIGYFTPIGFDIFHIGSTELSRGAYLAIPYNFRYNTLQEVEKSTLLVDGTNFNFNSDAGKSLLNSLVLSENAKKFAIAREVYASTASQQYVLGGVSFCSVLTTYAISRLTNLKLNLHAAHRSVRLVVYAMAAMMGGTTYLLLKDTCTLFYDGSADKQACAISETYCKGGIEFYEKILERNKGLREALGDRGKKTYTNYGNEQVMFRTPRLPITDRLENVKKLLKKYEKPVDDSHSHSS